MTHILESDPDFCSVQTASVFIGMQYGPEKYKATYYWNKNKK